MTDVHSKQVRSYNMSRIRSTNTRPEMQVRKFLFAHGYRYRLHSKNLPGKPDIFLAKHQTAIFVNGCFWHGHSGCRYYVVPKSRTEWWLAKIAHNQQNELKAISLLKEKGIRVLTIWECELKKKSIAYTLQNLLLILDSA